jgi:hypothetical protein
VKQIKKIEMRTLRASISKSLLKFSIEEEKALEKKRLEQLEEYKKREEKKILLIKEYEGWNDIIENELTTLGFFLFIIIFFNI